MIKVIKKACCDYTVIVENVRETKHLVTLSDVYYTKLTKGKISKTELIKKSFEFLLEKESQDSIMSKFNLKVIQTYFSDFEEVILKQIGSVD